MLDNYDLFLRHEAQKEAEQAEWLKRLPKCAKCNKPIQDDYLYDLGDEIVCENCLNKHYRKHTENFMQ